MLENTQELDLRRRRRLTDLVEEERAGRGSSEETFFVFHGASERSLHVAEELTLEQSFGKCATVDRQERSIDAIGEIVDVTRDDLLTRTRFTLNEHRRFRRCDGLGKAEHVEPALAGADGTRAAGALAPADLLLE